MVSMAQIMTKYQNINFYLLNFGISYNIDTRYYYYYQYNYH